MKEEQVLGQTRKGTRWPILVGVLALVVPVLFFTAAIIPVEGIFTIHGSACGSYTDWQSPSYYLLNIGYHHVVIHAFCL